MKKQRLRTTATQKSLAPVARRIYCIGAVKPRKAYPAALSFRSPTLRALGNTSTVQSASSDVFPPIGLLFKRVVDLCIAVPFCVILAPVFALIAVAIRLESEGPVFFVQDRRGKGFKLFRFVKFRSLRHAAPDPHARYEMVAADPRITLVGAFLRRSSLDELPQLFQVIAGSMSLVGPRPLVEWESQECLNGYSDRFCVKPGITGLSQVTVRNSVDLAGRCEKDLEYVHGWSLGLDLRILLSTPLALLSGSGVYPVASKHPAAKIGGRHG